VSSPVFSQVDFVLIKELTWYLVVLRVWIEGVMVAEKDFNAPSHPDLPQVRNLEVIKAMQSLTSKGYVKTQFSWQWYYYTLTPEGLDYLREVSRRMRRVWSRLGLGGS
jgi:hypothetical protein